MIKLILLTLCLGSLTTLAQDNEPSKRSHAIYSGKLTILKSLNLDQTHRLKLKLAIEAGSTYTNSDHTSILAGTYYTLPYKQRLGVFISSHTGTRHNDDWNIKQGNWSWKDTSKRSETILHLTHTIKKRLSSLPLIYELASEIQHNTFNEQNSLLLGPSIHYFHLEDGLPHLSTRVKLPVYFALNFGEEKIYKYGIYLAEIYHYTKKVSIALNYEFLVERWSTSDDFDRLNPNESYMSEEETNKFSVEIIGSF